MHNFTKHPHPVISAKLNRLKLVTAAGWAIAVLIVLTSLLVFVPFAPSLPVNTLDSGWQFGLNVAIAKGWVFGRDIIFTFGPYAPVYTRQYYPATDAQMLWSSSVIALAFAASLICLTQGLYRLLALGFSIFLILLYQDSQFYAVSLVALLLVCRTAMPEGHRARITPAFGVKVALALMTVALAMLTLVKGTFAISSGCVVLIGFILFYTQGRKPAAFCGVALFLAAMAALWVIAGQPITALPVFFKSILPVISGYAAAMSVSGPGWQLLVYGACCVALGILLAWTLSPGTTARNFMIAGSGAIMFLSFKEGFVRDDVHAMMAAGVLAAAGWIAVLGRQGIMPFAGLAIGLTGWYCINYGQLGVANAGPVIATVADSFSTPFELTANGLLNRVLHRDALKNAYLADMIQIQEQQPLPRIVGTADIYSYNQSALLADGMDWDPRPLMQSYTVYTPSLERADANHLTGPHAPANILFSLQPLNNNLPALEDGASWPIFLSRYEITELNDEMVFLKRRQASPAVNPIANRPSFTSDFRLGERIPLPPTPILLWAKADIEPTFIGRIFGMLFKPPQLNITYFFPNGGVGVFRYVAGMGASGFLAAPVVQSPMDFTALALPDTGSYFAENRPTAMMITAVHERNFWRASFSLQFFAMNIPPQPAVTNLLFSASKIEAKQAAIHKTDDCSFDLVNYRPVSHLPVMLQDFVRLDGWAVISGKDGIAPDKTTVTLTSSGGTVFAFPSKPVARPDVNAMFGKAGMGLTGYISNAQLLNLSGDYTLGLELDHGGQTWICSKQLPVHIQNTHVAN